MRLFAAILYTAVACTQLWTLAAHAENPPAWAYPSIPPGYKPPPDDGTLRRVPGSTASYTLTQVSDRFVAPDWHPNERPPMPDVVARGRKPDVFACGFCHRADGVGGSENANLTGLPASYIIQQLADFRSGARKSSVPQLGSQKAMANVAKMITTEEAEAAAAYFSSVKPRSIVRVVEAAAVPKTRLVAFHFAAATTRETEPIDRRIVEVPEDLEQFVSRDTNARFVAYVPPGSIQRGQMLASSVDEGRTPCSVCHGARLKGLGPVPGIAGRSPSYIVRQLYDIKHGNRSGAGSALMKGVVANLTEDDMIGLAAYVASLTP